MKSIFLGRLLREAVLAGFGVTVLLLASSISRAEPLTLTESIVNLDAFIDPSSGLTDSTTIAGRTVQVSGVHATGDVAVTGKAIATTNFGLNRIAVGGGYASSPGSAATANPDALSRWFDTWTISGGSAAGSVVPVTLFGTTTFSLGSNGFDLSGATNTPLGAALQITVNGGGAITLLTDDFVANRGAGRIDWSYTFDATSDSAWLIGSSFLGFVSGGNNGGLCVPLGVASCSGGLVFDAGNTALLTRVELPTGFSVSSESAELVAKDGYFAYKAVLAETDTTQMPEPDSNALMLIGVLGLAFTLRRVCSPPRAT